MDKIKAYLFTNKTAKQMFFKNTFWLTFGNIVSRVIKMVLIIYAARILGTAGYGVFSYALSLAAFFTIFSDLGLTALLTRELIKKESEIERYLSTTFFLKIIVLLITILLTIFIAPYFTKISEIKSVIPFVALLLCFDSLRGFGYAITRSQNRMEFEALFEIITNFVITVGGILILFVHPNPLSLTLSYAIGSGVGMLLVFIALNKRLRLVFHHFDKNLLYPIFSAAWPFAVVGLFGALMLNIDTIIIGWFRSVSEVGLYGAAQRPISIFYLFPAILATSLFPIVSKMIKDNRTNDVRYITEKSLLLSLAVAIPLMAGCIVLGENIIVLLFSKEYIGATLTFQLLALNLPLVFIGNLIGNIIFAYDEQKIFLYSTGFGGLTNVVFDLLLIPLFGIAGSAVATFLSEIVSNGIVWVKLKKILSFEIKGRLNKIILATIVMSIAIWLFGLIHINTIINILFGIIIYFLTLYLLKEPLLREISL
ncbi:MAG: flippase [Minisyncoccia bacterium]